ncbi:DUF4365 domain-containing protein [Paenibacillus tundrae]
MERKYEWSRLNHLQLGRYAEYFVKMEFTLLGCEVYTSEVDDRGIDFVFRKDGKYYDIQVKSVRNNNYIYLAKSKFELRESLLAAIVLMDEGASPRLYVVPSTRWLESDALFSSKDYEGLKSNPEWGLNLSRKNMPLLEPYAFENSVARIFNPAEVEA